MILIYPGVHPVTLTNRFLAGLGLTNEMNSPQYAIFPTEAHPPYSGFHCRQFMNEVLQAQGLQDHPVSIIAFSAGVVGAIAAAQYWHHRGIAIANFIAIDGWGVPLAADFPIFRMSHDHFTHWSSALLGAGELNFYADPAVGHLKLWQAPDQAMGQVVASDGEKGVRRRGFEENRVSAAQFIHNILNLDSRPS
ncbi:MAG: hypothetical protein ACTS2F_16595 [Thainema sp.]